MRRHLLAGLALLAPAVAAPLPVTAQVAVVDQGSFTISVQGSRAGREEFLIRTTPGASQRPTYLATAVVVLGDRRLSPRLATDESASPVGYDMEIRGSEGTQSFNSKISRGHMSARIRTPRGESGKEFVVADGAFILDEDVFHQYYFLARAKKEGPVAVVVPKRNAQVTMRVAQQGRERVTIGSGPVEANKMTVSEPGGADRQVWFDDQGRILRVEIPSRGITAVRDEAPR